MLARASATPMPALGLPRGTSGCAAGAGCAGTLVDVRTVGGFVSGQTGAGTVHRVAFGVADDSAQRAIRSQVIQAGYDPTPVIDRDYFHSFYFREPGGILF